MKPSPSLSTLPCFPYIKPMSILLESKIRKGTLPVVSSSLRFAFPVHPTHVSFLCFYSVVLSPQVGYDCTWWETNGSPYFPLHNPLLLSSNENPKSFLPVGSHAIRTRNRRKTKSIWNNGGGQIACDEHGGSN